VGARALNHEYPSNDESQALSAQEMGELWTLFGEIHEAWGSVASRPDDMASNWREFIQLKVSGLPSYLHHYRLACELLSELRQTHGDRLYQYLFFDGELHRHPDTRLASLKRYVIDEFIRVYVSSGGFRSFGGKNYTGFVSGSRYRAQRPYRSYEGT
jgi:hypothetical protein